MRMYTNHSVPGSPLYGLLPGVFTFISILFAILVLIGSTHNKPVLRTTYFLEVNITRVLINTPGGVLDGLFTSVEHALGIHDFYRYGLWGFCEGYNDTVVSCSHPEPGHDTNPIASINSEITTNSVIPMPSVVETNVHRLESLSVFVFACWIVGITLSCAELIAGIVVGCRSRLSACLVGILALVAFLFLLLASVIPQVLYSRLRDAMNEANFIIIDLETRLGKQMFAFVWVSCAASGISLSLWVLDRCLSCHRRRISTKPRD